ncbi:pyridoxal-phosphate-dependent aminotransferase family protein [Marinithermus hydrothermalis]|uniref:Alanine--glyoxylate transaminase n=1 Tax=Marinithermus hydrothermalis (strain DSM 14884 / JCM 11576 / T1) TaxID=869210 RepID=F2NPG3_MARHT|nr:aminotransferase class V-fold PLP-dependent enzyme [Marinithermus hydrothermalis]AEB12244.1 Alanine--glyoxylate transaminase [Marinithermus hydrothermalis DSM 14884]
MVLLTPGPTPIPPRVQAALARPMRAHLDPEVLETNRRIQAFLRDLYDPGEGALVAALAGTGSLGMEAGLAGLTRAGDRVLVLENGAFGARIAQIARQHGLEVDVVSAPPGWPVDPEDVARALRARRYRIVAVVHGETSTGVRNPVEAIGALARAHGALYMVDAVTTAGMLPFSMQRIGADYAFTGSQKCLSAPPGLAPFALSARARAALGTGRVWYTDFTRIAAYWEQHAYHHTAPVPLHYALEEALSVVFEEGLEARRARAERLYRAAASVLEDLGFRVFAREGARLETVLVVTVPEFLDEAELRRRLRAAGVVVAGGIGPTAGRVLRLGLMGEGAREAHYRAFFRALEQALGRAGLEEAFAGALEAPVR